MTDTLANLLRGLQSADATTRAIIGIFAVALVAVVSVAVLWSGRPHMVPLLAGLDDAQFAGVTRALATAGVRYETSSPPAPYSVFVDQSQRYTAQNAIHAEGALDLGERGIPSSSATSTIFLGKDERDQINLKRKWQELENQLRALSFISNAFVRISPGVRSPLLRQSPPTVSVLVHLKAGRPLTRMQRQTLAAIVRNAANVPDENITIADQDGNNLTEGVGDDEVESALSFERDFVASETRRAQEFLDRVFGAGMSAVSVVGEWDHERREVVEDSYDPAKLMVSETVSETRTPMPQGAAGGPAGTASTIDQASAPAGASDELAETLDSEKRYTYGTRTTHSLQAAPRLVRLAVTLTIDATLTDRLGEAEALVKDLVGFQEGRDQMTATAIPLATVARDGDGNLVQPEPEPVPEAPSAMLTLLLERGVEVLAAVAFLFVLLRSLKRSSALGKAAQAPEASGEDDRVDVEMLARRRVEQMVETEPEKVGALLSRWVSAESNTVGAGR